MTRRLETRLKTELPIRLDSPQGKSQMEGTVYDISVTHFHAKFPIELSPNRKYSFQIVLPNNQQIQGQASIDKSHDPLQSDDCTFVIEDLSVEEEQIITERTRHGYDSSVNDKCII